MAFTTKNIIILLLVVPVVSILVHQIITINYLAENDKPSKDFGSGLMFDTIASRYDLINRVLAMRMDINWRSRMVNVIKERVPSSNAKLLDVATGTADVALQLVDTIPSATIIGVDPSNGMLDVGRTKISDKGLSNQIILKYADARDLSPILPTPNVFDGATMAFGIRNVPEPREIALCQIHNVLKDKGVFCILEFSEPNVDEFGIMGYMARFFIRYIVPIIGSVLSGSPKEYLHLQNSIKDFPSPTKFASIMENLQCNNSINSNAEGDGTSATESTEGRNYFRVDDIVQMNFGSVQLYVATVMKNVK